MWSCWSPSRAAADCPTCGVYGTPPMSRRSPTPDRRWGGEPTGFDRSAGWRYRCCAWQPTSRSRRRRLRHRRRRARRRRVPVAFSAGAHAAAAVRGRGGVLPARCHRPAAAPERTCRAQPGRVDRRHPSTGDPPWVRRDGRTVRAVPHDVRVEARSSIVGAGVTGDRDTGVVAADDVIAERRARELGRPAAGVRS